MTTRGMRTRRDSTDLKEETPAVLCFLCNGNTTKSTTPSQWKNDDARRYALDLNVPQDGLICPACRKDITRVMSNADHVPRWAKTPAEKYCCVVECKDTVFSALHKTSSQEIEQLFISCGLRSTTPSIPIPTPLCKHHYHLIYNKVHRRSMYEEDKNSGE